MSAAAQPVFGLPDVQSAARRLGDRVRRTPLLEFAELNSLSGARVMLKCENLQHAGSFKYRGALHALLRLDADARRRGVIAYSSGNHALALARAARGLGVQAVVLMPEDAPLPKIAGARAEGAEVILYDRSRDDRVALCAALQARRGLHLVSPFDDEAVMAGQGTVALEALEQARAQGAAVDAFLVPCSGGGLAAGCAAAVHALLPDCTVHAVEPEHFDDTSRSLAGTEVAHNVQVSGSLCDALLVSTPGRLTLPVLRRSGVRGWVVPDEQVRAAMAFACNVLKLVVEPGGAIALAAMLQAPEWLRGRCVVLVLSGGNVDPALMCAVLRGGTAHG